MVAEALRSSGRLSAAVGVSRVLGLMRDQIFAALFGAGYVADAYQVAFRLPNLLRDLFAEGALSSAFVPTFTDALVKEDRDAAYHLGNLIFTGLALVTGLLTALGVIYAEWLVDLMAAGFDGDTHKLMLATRLARVMMPLLAVISLSAVWMGMLNAQRSFTAPAYAPALFNVASILTGGTLLILGLGVEDGIFWWSVGTMAAGGVQALVQLPSLWRLGYRPRLVLRGFFGHPGVRRVLRLMGPAVLGLAAVQINVVVNTQFASALPGDGPVAQLGYAFRVFYLPVGIFSVAIATVTTTRVSEDAARGDVAALGASAADGMSAVWMLMTASGVGLFCLAEPVVQLLFERGAFDHEATLATAAVLRSYVLGLLPYGLVKVLAPVFYGVDRVRVPLFASMSAVVINIAFNALTYRELGAPGIALGTTLGAVTNYAILRIGLRRVAGPLVVEGRARQSAALVLGNALMGGLVWGAWWAWQNHAPQALQASTLVRLALVGGLVAIGFVSYVATLRAFRYPGAELLASLPSKIFRKLRGR